MIICFQVIRFPSIQTKIQSLIYAKFVGLSSDLQRLTICASIMSYSELNLHLIYAGRCILRQSRFYNTPTLNTHITLYKSALISVTSSIFPTLINAVSNIYFRLRLLLINYIYFPLHNAKPVIHTCLLNINVYKIPRELRNILFILDINVFIIKIL